jgi:hypothetical protein
VRGAAPTGLRRPSDESPKRATISTDEIRQRENGATAIPHVSPADAGRVVWRAATVTSRRTPRICAAPSLHHEITRAYSGSCREFVGIGPTAGSAGLAIDDTPRRAQTPSLPPRSGLNSARAGPSPGAGHPVPRTRKRRALFLCPIASLSPAGRGWGKGAQRTSRSSCRIASRTPSMLPRTSLFHTRTTRYPHSSKTRVRSASAAAWI